MCHFHLRDDFPRDPRMATRGNDAVCSRGGKVGVQKGSYTAEEMSQVSDWTSWETSHYVSSVYSHSDPLE